MDQVACRTYTHARRYPWVIGRIGGWQLPVQLTPAQLLAMGATLWALIQTRVWWAHLPRLGNLVVELGLPAASAWAARRLRLEGRSPLRSLAGLGAYLAAPRSGTVHGRAARRPSARRLDGRVSVR